MKRKNREFINNIQYLKNDIAEKMLRSIKLSNRIFYLTYILLTITYVLLMIHVISFKGLLLVTAIYLMLSIDFAFTQKRYTQKISIESIDKTICPEAYINLNLYNAKKILCNERMYKNSLNNIAYGYILLGDFEKAEQIIKYVDSMKKDLILQSEILKNKIEIAFLNENIKQCNKECENLEKIIKFIPGKYKKEAKFNIDIKRAINEKNYEKVESLCNDLNKKRKIFYKVNAAYYKGLLQEKTQKDNYEEYYEFVAENGNNLFIANKAREKLGKTKKKNIYIKSNHIVYKLFKIAVFLITLSSTIFWSMYTIYIFNK